MSDIKSVKSIQFYFQVVRIDELGTEEEANACSSKYNKDKRPT